MALENSRAIHLDIYALQYEDKCNVTRRIITTHLFNTGKAVPQATLSGVTNLRHTVLLQEVVASFCDSYVASQSVLGPYKCDCGVVNVPLLLPPPSLCSNQSYPNMHANRNLAPASLALNRTAPSIYIPVHKRTASKENFSPVSSYTGCSSTMIPSPVSPAFAKLDLEEDDDNETCKSITIHTFVLFTSAAATESRAAIYSISELVHLAQSPLSRLPHELLMRLQAQFPQFVMNKERRRGLIAQKPEWKIVPAPKEVKKTESTPATKNRRCPGSERKTYGKKKLVGEAPQGWRARTAGNVVNMI